MKKSFLSVFLTSIMLFQASIFIVHGEGPNISASSAIVMDVQTGRILYSKDIHAKKPMASTTKIMTALLALENSSPDAIVKIPRQAVGVEGSSIYLQNDEKVKMEDLVYGLMLRSGNDSAVAIASHISGSVEEFCALMNRRSKELGANNTNFMNPHGLHDDQHYTTAYDLALISRQALLNKEFKKIVSTKLWTADREGFKYFYNKNKTLTQYEGGDGVKTGFTKKSGRCLVTSATRNGMQLVTVVLNAPDWFQDSYNLLDYAFDRYKPYSIAQQDSYLKSISVKNGKKPQTAIVSRENVIIPVTEEEKNKVMSIIEVDEIMNAPVSRNTKIGKLKVYLDSKLIYTTDLFTREDIAKKDFKDKFVDFIQRK
ncbi:D-alanyl-D-alanine carboxypeptidase (penicillin-binding protein 5/6) [Anaerosolibacter carboniphilus]|uniref:serine-type D-Ala-D-Ala carboxypeptidase n=1 Tax=Anaerosolibacter carboniphilus TaxID=1417629 RepID=A0A841L2U0_9FIRM|nr:D-alanyl-D-alanine carboxypeptidase family protein [Anaerosolibacter carboniphilus]MBB6216665.1 D-alanyl-D-alanine carboxypeptidase (penicillin-binding protein 5/6) [Anaerosolibacter carboniphilus]